MSATLDKLYAMTEELPPGAQIPHLGRLVGMLKKQLAHGHCAGHIYSLAQSLHTPRTLPKLSPSTGSGPSGTCNRMQAATPSSATHATVETRGSTSEPSGGHRSQVAESGPGQAFRRVPNGCTTADQLEVDLHGVKRCSPVPRLGQNKS